ncbi:cardiolipin synthase [Aequorivita todarodis]|uniref:cardiolipin synthase n=1 Tax=Aequorivita todarodis TaxID=2036821 RepID=UPI0023504F17|nr:cardiolipin synthase [Aequorivita todarodis]MDC8002279.1 cardiolipin synthase [Aequorivita todarodis]
MNWILIAEILYAFIVVLVCLRVVYDTQSTTKTLAYLLLIVFVPFIGIIFYFSIGVNYRKRKMYSKNLINNIELEKKLEERIRRISNEVLTSETNGIKNFKKLATLVLNKALSPITEHNNVKLLLNGETKFPEVLEALKNAKHHIHIEYYIFDNDEIGRKIMDLMVEKSKEGIAVRFIYDDFGSRQIRKKQLRKLRDAGVAVFPFYKIILIALANRLNYRNHRKIIVIDGSIGFVGGINVNDKYINHEDGKNTLFWRDTHLRIEGPAVAALQYVFMGDWNYCAGKKLKPDNNFFPDFKQLKSNSKKIVQIAASGPDSYSPLIHQTLLQAINLAKEEVLITTPYFIPGESIMDSLAIVAASGIKVKLLVPGISDSLLVNFAARSNYGRLLNAGAEIYLYQKGFVHAKTMVVDKQLAMVGTANMDIRSFDLNFEVNAIVYDTEIANELREAFFNDLKTATKIDAKAWNERSKMIQLTEKLAGLCSPLL